MAHRLCSSLKSQAFDQTYKYQLLHIITGTYERDHQQLMSPQNSESCSKLKTSIGATWEMATILNSCLSIFFFQFCKCFNPFIYRSVVGKERQVHRVLFSHVVYWRNEDSSAFFILHKTMKIDLTARKNRHMHQGSENVKYLTSNAFLRYLHMLKAYCNPNSRCCMYVCLCVCMHEDIRVFRRYPSLAFLSQQISLHTTCPAMG